MMICLKPQAVSYKKMISPYIGYMKNLRVQNQVEIRKAFTHYQILK